MISVAKSNNFRIKLPLFEGPFDLLLFFIERDELDIYDVPIHTITNDFLDYIHQLDQMNVEVASEFILVAATLMRIKSKMLLPRPTLDEEGNEEDPREELIHRLLEYKKYKSVINTLNLMEKERLDREKRGNLVSEIKKLSETINIEAEMQNIDLYKLMKVFQKVMQRHELKKNKPVHQVFQYPYTIEGQKVALMKRLENGMKLSFKDLVAEKPQRILVIFYFLSILELMQTNKIFVHLGEGLNNFWMKQR